MKQHVLPAPGAWAGSQRAQSIVQRPGLWLPGIQLILAFEWLISSLNKLLDSNFDAGLLGVLRASTKGNPYGWYIAILQHIVIPHHTLFAFLTPLGEMAIGVTLAAGAALWVLRLPPRAITFGAGAVCAALLGSAFLSLNYFFQGGTTLPWINTSNAFTQGVDIDIIIPLLSIVLLAAYLELVLSARSDASRPSPAQKFVSDPQATFTLLGQGQRATLKSELGARVNESEVWVDMQGVCWTARQLLEKSPADLLGLRIIDMEMSIDEEGHGYLPDAPRIDEPAPSKSLATSFNLIRLRYRNGLPGPVMFVVASENHDPRAGVMALTGPVGEFLELRSPTPSDFPVWPLPDDAHAAFFEGDRFESPESA